MPKLRPLFGLVATVLLFLVAVAGVMAGEMTGHWERGDGNARVSIAPCGVNVCATNTWIKPGTPSEKTGDKLIMTIRPTGDGRYAGTAFDPQRELTYNLTVTTTGDHMVTRGCVLAGIICKGVEWTKLPKNAD